MRTLLPCFAAVVLTSACTAPDRVDEYRSVLPDERILIDVEVPAQERTVGDASQLLVWTLEASVGADALIGGVLAPLDRALALEPTWTAEDETATWGPWTGSDGNAYALVVQYDESDLTYGWSLGLLEDADVGNAFTPVIQGVAAADSDVSAYSGWFEIDFEVVGALNGGLELPDDRTGTFTASYGVDDDGVSGSVEYADFGEIGGATVSWVYGYHRVPGVGGRFNVVLEADVEGTSSDASNTVTLLTRWQVSHGGRADAHVVDDDVVHSLSECWDATGSVVWEDNPFAGGLAGDIGACAFTEAEFVDDP